MAMKNAWELPTLYGACDVKGMPAGKAHFIAELPDHRYLVCHSLNNLGCFEPKARTYVLLMDKIAKLHEYRYFVGACPLTGRHTAMGDAEGLKAWQTIASVALCVMPSEYRNPQRR